MNSSRSDHSGNKVFVYREILEQERGSVNAGGARPRLEKGRAAPFKRLLVFDAATVRLGRRRVGAAALLFRVEAVADVIEPVGPGLAPRRVVVDRAVVSDLAVRADDEHVRRGLRPVGVADLAALVVEHRTGDAELLIVGDVLGGFQEIAAAWAGAVDAEPDDLAVLLDELGHGLFPRMAI